MSADANRQVKQMVNFIMQEAHEKVNEIKIKVRSLKISTCLVLIFCFFLD